MIKADVTLDNTTLVGVTGKDVEEIIEITKERWGLSDYGASKLKVKIRNDDNRKESDEVENHI